MPVSPEFRLFLDRWRITPAEIPMATEKSYIDRVPSLSDIPDSERFFRFYENPDLGIKRRLQEAGLEKWQRGVVGSALNILDRLLRLFGFSQITVGELRKMTVEDWRVLEIFRGLGPKRISILEKLFSEPPS